MNVYKIRNDLEYYDLNNLIKRYGCFMRGNTLVINKEIPVNEFIILRTKLRAIKRVDNIIVEAEYGGENEIIRFI
jgi:hypothetical protein